MPTFTIEAPDGRKLDIEADDENGAIAGAQDWVSKNPKPAASPPSVPLYASAGNGAEVNVNASPEIRVQYDAMTKQQDEAKAQEQAQFDATRTPGARVADTASFMASLPVRAATRGEYGAGDVAGLVSPDAGNALAQSEQDFARANQGGLEAAAAAGEVMAGIPMLNTMGGVPGQMLNTSAAALRQTPKLARQFMREERGAVQIPGGGGPSPANLPTGGGTPPPVPPAPPAAPPPRPYEPARLPTRDEAFQSAGRLSDDLGVKVDLPEMVVGPEYKQNLAAGLRSVPFAGEPISAAFDKGLKQLETAKAAAGARVGNVATPEIAGQGVKSSAQTWMTRNSKETTRELYEDVYNRIDQAATRPLQATARISTELQNAMQESTGTAGQAAVNLVREAINRPGGLNVRGISALRSEVGEHVDALAVNKAPGQRAMGRLYGALTEDLRAAVRQAGGPEALRAWEVANREARVIAGKRQRLSRIVGVGEDKLSAEAVLEKVNGLARAKGGNLRDLRLIKEVAGEQQFKDMAATLLDRMGFKDDLGLFSADRFLTEYGKLNDGARHLLWGPSKTHLDDTAMIALKFQQLSSKFNRSNTGIVNSVLKLFANPGVATANVATAMVNPAAALTIGGQAAGVAGMRSMAHALSRPSQLAKANKVLKAYFGVASVAHLGKAAIAKREQGLAAAVRSVAQAVAQETGQSADDFAAELMKQFKADISQSMP